MPSRRLDAIGIDLRAALPGWASRLLGIPGASAFTRFEKVVARSHAAGSEYATLADLTRATASGTDADARFLALAAEAARRALGYTPYDEQLVAACAVHAGFAVELDTGEGKTLVGAIAAALHGLSGRRVHVLSVNDYLARRDAEWMGPLFTALGLDVSWIGQGLDTAERRRAYEAAVVYAPVSEVGYDILRDRQATDAADRVSPVRDVAIVDEADAVMIDDAMTPLVLAGTSPDQGDDVAAAADLVAALEEDRDFALDGDRSTASLTDEGLDAIERRLGGVNLFDAENAAVLTRLNLALHARMLVHRDVDYLVADDGIRLINTARGRVAASQRWPDGLHAAVEAKEGLPITPPGIVLDSVTVQDLLRGYRTLSGMSGTILSVADELTEFYSLPSGREKRHRPLVRTDLPLRVLSTEEEKTDAVAAEILRRHAAGQPVLVGTQSVAESEELASRLPIDLDVRVLNARNDAEEATIIARAGEYGAVTISTQMSGRGTDIRLGGVDENDRDRVVAAGGLAVLATGLYPSRRLDQQLRGRAGRQGDPGESLAFSSLEDELVLANATSRTMRRMERGPLDTAARLEAATEAQRIAEAVRLDRHRSTWEYARAITQQRDKVLRVREEVRESAPGPERTLRLYFLDEHWSDHLALLTEVRDGIHLRVLAGQNPVDEFHRIALREFAGFFDAVDEDVRRSLDALAADATDVLESLGLRRPSATWTYMMRDNPIGDAASRAADSVQRAFRGFADRVRPASS